MLKDELHGLLEIKNLKEQISWSMGLSGLLKWLCWEPDNILGKSKKSMILQTIKETLKNIDEKETDPEKIYKNIYKVYRQERKQQNFTDRYSEYSSGCHIDPYEAQRRVRYFSEDFLNKEFDIFFSLLPSKTIDSYLANFFNLQQNGRWCIFGNSNDFEISMQIFFMQIDTILYNQSTSDLVALELKIDAELGEKQILQYCFMASSLEKNSKINKNSNFNILVISTEKMAVTEKELIEKSFSQLENKIYPKKRILAEEVEKLIPRTKEILNKLNIGFTTWQDLGIYFQKELDNVKDDDETYFKLIKGFLSSLSQKYSKKGKKFIYRGKQVLHQYKTISFL